MADDREKQIFSLKMQIHFLEEKLASTKPENSEITIKQNIELKVMNQTLEMELKGMKKANRDLNRDLTRVNTALHETQMKHLTAEDSELEREYRAVCEDLKAQADELERERDERTKLALEVERLEWEQQRASHERSESRAEALEERELERKYRAVCEDLNAQADELERERDERTRLALEVERLEWEQQRASHERSESRAEALEEREEREAMEEVRAIVPDPFHVLIVPPVQDRNTLRDRLAAITIKDEQQQDEIDQLTRDIQELEEQLAAMDGELKEARERYDVVDQVSP